MLRILIIHSDATVRRSIEETLRRATADPLTLYEAPSATEGLRRSRHVEPDVILLTLTEDPELALEVARELRRPDRLLIGLFNPLIPDQGGAEFFRRAARCGIADFIPLPASENELGEALAAAAIVRREERPRREGRVVSFFSQKGGVGTTTLAVSTALALAASDRVEGGVALCDAVVQFGTAATLLGLVPERDLADVARDIDDLTAVATQLTRHGETGLSVLAAPRDPREAEVLAPETLARVLIALRRRFGLLVIDTPSRLDLLSLAALDLSDTVVVVTEAAAPTLLATARLLGLLEEQGFTGKRVRVLLNRYSAAKGSLPPRTVTDLLGRAVDYAVARDESVLAAATRGNPLSPGLPEAEYSQAVAQLAEDLLQGGPGEE